MFILQLLNFCDRHKLFRAARQAGDIQYQNNQLMLFPDYSVKTQKLCISFEAIKPALRARKIVYSVLFPPKLRVVDGETVHFFTSTTWLESLPPHG